MGYRVCYLHLAWVHCDTSWYNLSMEIHQPNEIYFQHHDHEARSKMMYPKINLYNGLW